MEEIYFCENDHNELCFFKTDDLKLLERYLQFNGNFQKNRKCIKTSLLTIDKNIVNREELKHLDRLRVILEAEQKQRERNLYEYKLWLANFDEKYVANTKDRMVDKCFAQIVKVSEMEKIKTSKNLYLARANGYQFVIDDEEKITVGSLAIHIYEQSQLRYLCLHNKIKLPTFIQNYLENGRVTSRPFFGYMSNGLLLNIKYLWFFHGEENPDSIVEHLKSLHISNVLINIILSYIVHIENDMDLTKIMDISDLEYSPPTFDDWVAEGRGLDSDEIQTVMNQVPCSRSQAVAALRNNSNIVDAILSLIP